MIWSLVILPFAGAALVMLLQGSRFMLGATACVTLASTVLAAVAGTIGEWSARLAWSRWLELTAGMTPTSATMAVLVPVIALPVVLYAAAHEEERGLARLIALMLLFVGSMELLVVATDLLTLLIGWELVGACSWALIGHHWRDAANPASGQYAFLATRLGDLGLFVAAMAAFAGTGSFAYEALERLSPADLQIVAFGLLVSAAAKAGQVPFAPWLFRAMAGPTSVSALLHAATMVAAGAYLLIRLEPQLNRAEGFAALTLTIGLVTALAGGLVALIQNHAKKLLAASTSAHYGLMFVAVGTGYPAVALLHLVAHAAFKAALFLSAGVAGERADTYALDKMGFGRVLPVTAAFSAVAALALAGVPPLGAGWTKETIVAAAGHDGRLIALAVIVAGGLSAAYGARFQWLAFRRAHEVSQRSVASGAERAGVGALAVLTLALSVLWLPAVHDPIAQWLDGTTPTSSTLELLVSIAFVGGGLASGAALATRRPRLGAQGRAAWLADWLGLPVLINRAVIRPTQGAAVIAARLDDAVLDALPRSVGRAGRRAARSLSRRDRLWVDAGVQLTGAFTEWLARIGNRVGEAITDTIPEGTARLVGAGGRLSRMLQSGLSHQYYALLFAGAVLAITLLLLVT